MSLMLAPIRAGSAPYAAMVMDARTGEVLHSRNADTRLHPASLTKMMTLYIAFQAVQRGEISLDTPVTISRLAASEPPSKLGLRQGQTIRLRFLLRAAAVKSANDASTAIAEAISGSEEAFATRMNRTARAMGMRNTTFRNAHGLTQSGHLSTARDMSILGRHVIYDFPQYYNLFSRRSADAGIATVRHTNRRWLDAYEGGDGIKTGYTRAAGFNLVASAQRGQERIIATVFGGSSTAARNARITELMDMGFNRAPSRATIRRPNPPIAMLSSNSSNSGGAIPGGKIVRVSGLVATSMRPIARPLPQAPEPEALVAAVDTDSIDAVLASAVDAAVAEALGASPPVETTVVATATPAVTPTTRPAETVVAAVAPPPPPAVNTEPEVVTRISTSGGRHWGVNVGRYNTRYDAERVLLRVALNEMSSLDGALRRVVQRSGGFDANFMGLTREGADLACRRLQARGTTCFMIGSDS
ncbi:D-alanyl-D-alanine carboxypeptidase family protein [Cognatiyoonia sp. IB215446]|uniref:D-alanyl-D-alanine carboxypeptidase family protein n=1 Tax=Cognatiyoonia sp. IB215446 TaxID=3097355 RepID=UPI002A101DAF|nr:D-alanyl-D-alanine carboxypeptidase family protein [Cognatiyoonia sp. IB215446]MDX8347422.1 D-alanyl-D-alanine carboxypeptidase family protein [Cognatiyoonia sp. IB215446]